jgi:hypothetical protein
VIDFPASPTDGQVFNAPNGVAYQYNATYSSWLAQSAAPGVGPYLPLTGGTLAGPGTLTGTTATFNTGADTALKLTGDTSNFHYNMISLNGVTTEAGSIGFIGGGTGDGNLYANVPTGFNYVWRVNGVATLQHLSGYLIPSVDLGLRLGGPSNRWLDVQANTATFAGTLTGTTATFNGGGVNGALKVTTNDSIIGGLFAGATKGVRIVPNAAYTAIEGVDNTGVGSYQPLTISGSVVNIAAPLSGTTATLSTAIAAGSNDTTVPTTAWVRANISGGGSSGKLLQTVYNRTGTGATGTTLIPFDTTIPQITEGDEYMTLAVTPTSATSLLIVDVVWIGSNSAVNNMGVALFKDSTASALTAAAATVTAANATVNIKFKYIMVSGSTAATTFRVRAGGGAAGTTSFNSGTTFGFVMCSSMTIQEVTP